MTKWFGQLTGMPYHGGAVASCLFVNTNWNFGNRHVSHVLAVRHPLEGRPRKDVF